MRRTKILATLGPATAKVDVLEAMIRAGLDAVRLNFSHGTHEGHAAVYRAVREASARTGKPIAVLQDLQGPKIRIGIVRDGGMDVPTGSTLVVTTRAVEGGGGVVSTVYEALPRDVTPGLKILLDEGRLELRVREVKGEDVICDVVDGGRLSSHKGISVPGATLTAAAMTDKDRDDVKFGLALGVDFVALSFVRRPEDVQDLRNLMIAEGRIVPIIAKIEKPQAVEAIDDIVRVADGVMVARGDLAIEASLEMIPAYQKRIIARANHAGKLVVTATQMLESMTENPLPTRAEVTDVANAVLDGTDAVMLSGETAVGKYPVETVRRMAAIAETTEETLYSFEHSVRGNYAPNPEDFAETVAFLAAQATRRTSARAVVIYTRSGQTALLLSDERPRPPILALTPTAEVACQLALAWGVRAHVVGDLRSTAEVLAVGERVLKEQDLAAEGDRIVFALGSSDARGASNIVELVRFGGEKM